MITTSQGLYTAKQTQSLMPYARLAFPKRHDVGWEVFIPIPTQYQDSATHWRLSIGPRTANGGRLYRVEGVRPK